jgi:hypothetical protein
VVQSPAGPLLALLGLAATQLAALLALRIPGSYALGDFLGFLAAQLCSWVSLA